ncbi:hypothetical protein EYF80_049680 [Liparis tanakae]|uniref:Uncharacterized protein n=1 Tax=Liparis tanakae TaxID=230148 RepID=A0A4Z2FG12_9TELE|nr:hypothetical protein EYF80_049680 [Liparis tanakae]
MPDFCEKAVSISCCGAVRVGTGLDDGVGAGATNARRISSVVAIRMKSWCSKSSGFSHIGIGVFKPRPRPGTPEASRVAPPLAVSASPVIRPALVGASAFTVTELRSSSIIML